MTGLSAVGGAGVPGFRDPVRARELVAAGRTDLGELSESVEADEILARIAWSALVEPGDGVAGALVERLGALSALRLVWSPASSTAPTNLRDAAAAVTASWLSSGGLESELPRPALAAGLARWRPRMREEVIDAVLHGWSTTGALPLVPGDAWWPGGLDALGPRAPQLLWVRGRVAAIAALSRSVALVGARTATGYGTHVASELSSGLTDRGVAIVSGGAYGIDGAAHRAAIAAGGTTVAVLAGGIDRLYPAGHTELLERVMREGAVVSEVPFGTAPTGFRFLQRNRVIAAVSQGTVVVEAGARSGSLNTANHAGQIGRPVGAVPGPVTSSSSAGCLELLRGIATAVGSAAHVIELISDGFADIDPAADLAFDVDDPRRGRILGALTTRAPRAVDRVAALSGMGVQETAAVLGLLSIEGRAERKNGGWVSVGHG